MGKWERYHEAFDQFHLELRKVFTHIYPEFWVHKISTRRKESCRWSAQQETDSAFWSLADAMGQTQSLGDRRE